MTVRILQVTSDWKWTGPAAPMLDLLRAQRAGGAEVDLACPEPPPGSSASSLAARARDADAAPALVFSRGRGARPLRDREDAQRLERLIRTRRYDVVHAWHTRDHVLCLRALGVRRGRAGPRIVRSTRQAEPPSPWPWNRWLLGPGADGVWCVSPRAAERYAFLRGGRPTAGWFGCADSERFHPGPPSSALRREFGVNADDRVIAIAARAQPHRRFDLLLEAMVRLARREPLARLLVLGRGTHLDETLRRPAQRLGLGDRVILAGHRGGDYPEVLRLAQIFTLLVPGSDGGCRAALEAAATGLATVASRRGVLPEIVVDGVSGLLADENPDALAAAFAELLANPARAIAMGHAARRRAEQGFNAEHFAERVGKLYASLGVVGPG